MSESAKAKYCIGQLIQHKLFDYRGIILGVDLEFKSTDECMKWWQKADPRKTSPGTMFWSIKKDIKPMLQNRTYSQILLSKIRGNYD